MSASINLDKVKELLAHGQTEPAADLLLELAKKSDKAHYHSALLLKNRLETLQHRAIEGVLSQSEERVEWARVSKGIMELVTQIERGEKPIAKEKIVPPVKVPEKKRALKAWYLALPVAVLLGVFFVPKMFNKATNEKTTETTVPTTNQNTNPNPAPVIESKTITLPGRVTTYRDKPVAGAEVIFEGYGKAVRVRTDATGRFEVKVPEAMVGKQVDLTIIHNGKKDPNKKSIRFSKALLPRLKYGSLN